MNVAIALNEKHIRYGYVLLTSVFENNQDESITIYIMHGGLSEEKLAPYLRLAEQYGQRVVFCEVTGDLMPEDLPVTENWTREIYFRLALSDLLPESEERVLYMDTDVVVDRSLKELYYVSFRKEGGDYLLAGCPDVSDGNLSDIQQKLFEPELTDPSFHYINSGMLLMNIAAMRGGILRQLL